MSPVWPGPAFLPDHYAWFCAASWVGGFARYVEAFLARYPNPDGSPR